MEKKLIKQILFIIIGIFFIILLEEVTKEAIMFLIFIVPVLPILYGYKTGNKIGSILTGVLPLSGFFSLMLFKELMSPTIPLGPSWLNKTISFYPILVAIVGFEGYFASQRKILIACVLFILWIFVFFLFGIH